MGPSTVLKDGTVQHMACIQLQVMPAQACQDMCDIKIRSLHSGVCAPFLQDLTVLSVTLSSASSPW